MSNFKSEFDQIETLIRSGRVDIAAKKLVDLNATQLPRSWRRPFANLARRAGLIDLGLKILAPLVRPKTRLERAATIEELAEYGVLLMRIGAVPEAQALLESLDPSGVPDVLLFRSFCHFSKWEYEQALPLIQKYLLTNLTPYQRAVGCLNLADTLIFLERFTEAQSLLEETLALALRERFGRVTGNCYEMLAQTALLTGALEDAATLLDQARVALNSEGTSDSLHLLRWKAVIDSLSAQSTAPLADFKALALARKEFESVRVADLFSQKIQFDAKTFDHLYFGTPYSAFRRKIESVTNQRPKARTYQIGADGPTLQLSTGAVDGESNDVAGSKIHSALNCLLLDFYRPVLPATAFSLVFPGEYFDIFSSPNRVHQLLRRTRIWLKQNGFAAKIEMSARGYKLELTGPGVFELDLDRGTVNREEVILRKLRARFADAFTAKEARHLVSLSETAMRQWLAWAIERDLVQKYGSGPKTVYVMTDVSSAPWDRVS